MAAKATRDDFVSNEAKGFPLRVDTPEARELHGGVSVNATLNQARKRTRTTESLQHYEYIAELSVPDDGSVRYRRTLRAPGHHTLWADPDVLLACVVSVHRVEAVD